MLPAHFTAFWVLVFGLAKDLVLVHPTVEARSMLSFQKRADSDELRFQEVKSVDVADLFPRLLVRIQLGCDYSFVPAIITTHRFGGLRE